MATVELEIVERNPGLYNVDGVLHVVFLNASGSKNCNRLVLKPRGYNLIISVLVSMGMLSFEYF